MTEDSTDNGTSSEEQKPQKEQETNHEITDNAMGQVKRPAKPSSNDNSNSPEPSDDAGGDSKEFEESMSAPIRPAKTDSGDGNSGDGGSSNKGSSSSGSDSSSSGDSSNSKSD